MVKFNEFVQDWAGDELHVEIDDNSGYASIYFAKGGEQLEIGESDIDALIAILTCAKEHIKANRTNC